MSIRVKCSQQILSRCAINSIGYKIMNDSKKSQNRNPIFDPLVECYGRGALTGLAAFWFVFTTSHFLQKPLRNRIGYSVAGSLAVSSALASTATYFITRDCFEKCSKINAESQTES